MIVTLDEAADFIRAYRDARLPTTQQAVREWLERARSPSERIFAAKAFARWAEAEGLHSMLH